MARVRVTVTNRKGVFDPEGKVVFNGLKRLGHDVSAVEVGKIFVLDFPTDDRDTIKKDVEKMCGEFIVNPILEDYLIEFIEE